MPVNHPVTLSPNVVGAASWPRVRPDIRVDACVRASRTSASAHRSRPADSAAVASAASIISAVSRMSWLVAPRCTQRAASSSRAATSRVSQAASGTTGLPEATAAAPSSSAS